MFTEFIAKTESIKQLKELTDTKFFTIVEDGSTDSTILEQEIHFLIFAMHGHIKYVCFGVEAYEKANAEGFIDAIMYFLRNKACMEKNELPKKLIAKNVGRTEFGCKLSYARETGVVLLKYIWNR